ncbi:hypothetical protein NC652_020258 [Populus alba x Populus x berolinensis]|uniref:Uncharacterized protein n=1 Tax=Populus alba TaxID=43335 RepID=A0A4U5Q527_POPAL|nr:hypothetical protein NC652_020258 [Populus alba x Populus x berolinensis]TKS04781.1 hypothetical protein D5086_0000140170 [Populus alba]
MVHCKSLDLGNFCFSPSEMYSLLLETYIKDSREKRRLFNTTETIPCVADKAEWTLNWIQRSTPFFSDSFKQYKKTLLRGLEVLSGPVFQLEHILSTISHCSPF